MKLFKLLLFTSLLFTTACSPKSDYRPTTPAAAGFKAQSFDFSKLFEEKEREKPSVECDERPCVVSHRLNGGVDETTVREAMEMLEAANEAKADRFVLEINSPGGSVWDGFELARAIENSTTPVSCVVDGEAVSMGFYILQSCETRYTTRRSSLMAHEPSLSGRFGGNPNDWQAMADHLKAVAYGIAEHCNHRLTTSMKDYLARVDGGRQWWFTWRDAVRYGAVDGVVDSVKQVINSYKK